MNQTHPVHEFNSLTEKLNHSFEKDIYSELVNPVDKIDLWFIHESDQSGSSSSLTDFIVLVATLNRPVEGKIINE